MLVHLIIQPLNNSVLPSQEAISENGVKSYGWLGCSAELVEKGAITHSNL